MGNIWYNIYIFPVTVKIITHWVIKIITLFSHQYNNSNVIWPGTFTHPLLWFYTHTRTRTRTRTHKNTKMSNLLSLISCHSRVRPSVGATSCPRPQPRSPPPASPWTPGRRWRPRASRQRTSRRPSWSRTRGPTPATCAAAPTSTPAPCWTTSSPTGPGTSGENLRPWHDSDHFGWKAWL